VEAAAQLLPTSGATAADLNAPSSPKHRPAAPSIAAKMSRRAPSPMADACSSCRINELN